LLKGEVCGSREQCTGPTGVAEKSNITAKKKKREMQTLDAQSKRCLFVTNEATQKC